MFTFWKQKEKPVIKWWSTIEGLEKVVPVLPAKEVIPDWWKRVERMITNKTGDKGTVKNCPALPEYMSQGFVVPLWCDRFIMVSLNGLHQRKYFNLQVTVIVNIEIGFQDMSKIIQVWF